MNRDARAHRDLSMAIEAATGRSRAEIAKRHGVGERTVRRAIERAEASGSPADNNCTELRRYWQWLEQAIEELGLERMKPGSSRDRVKAIEVQLSLMGERQEALTALGLIPQKPKHDDHERVAGVERLGQQLIGAAGRDGMGTVVEEWLKERIEEFAGETVCL